MRKNTNTTAEQWPHLHQKNNRPGVDKNEEILFGRFALGTVKLHLGIIFKTKKQKHSKLKK